MDINTRDFGTIHVEENAIYEFPNGLYGFDNDTQFAVFEQIFDDVSFLYLQSTHNLVPSFLVFDPWAMEPTYAPVLSKEDTAICEIESIEDVILLVIATVPSSIEQLSLNMKSPLVLNPKTGKGRQVILQNSNYSVRYKPFQKNGKEGS